MSKTIDSITPITTGSSNTNYYIQDPGEEEFDLLDELSEDEFEFQRQSYQKPSLWNRLKSSLKPKKPLLTKDTCIVGFLICSWYVFSFSLSVYNKWMFGKDHLNLHFPLLVTSTHMIMQFILSLTTITLIPSLRPSKLPKLRDYSTKVLPCGIATSLDIGLSNLSFKTLTLSFYTMCKSSSLAFVLLFAFLFKLEQPTWRLIGIIAIITVGVLLMVLDEAEFDLTGFIEVMIATMCGGLRWSLTQILLQKESLGMTNPAASLVFLTPIMFFSLIILSGPIEKPWELFYLPQFFGTFWVSLRTLGYMSIGGILAFCMVMSEFALISKTSVITLSVAGIFKEVLTLMLSGAIFGDKFSIINITGLIIALFGIFLYNVLKFNSGNSGHHGHGGGSSKFDSLQLDEDHHLDEYERLAPNTAPGMNMAPFIPPKSRHSLDDIVLQTRSPQN